MNMAPEVFHAAKNQFELTLRAIDLNTNKGSVVLAMGMKLGEKMRITVVMEKSDSGRFRNVTCLSDRRIKVK